MRVVTSGSAYLDIDAFAGCMAYAELLQSQGITACPVSSAPWNESITATIRSWGAPMLAKYAATPNDTFTLIDISDPAHLDPIVVVERIDEVIDHHPGFEQYWHERLGERAHIEFIGAACTQVYERWVAAGKFHHISSLSARLLATGILDNTLNFGARVTTSRDKAAYTALAKTAGLDNAWPAQYFNEAQTAILDSPATAIQNDTKTITFPGYPSPVTAGQLVIWDGPAVLKDHMNTIRQTLGATRPDWFMNLVSVGDGASYFIAESPAVQAWLTNLLKLTFKSNLAHAGRLWLRKEIIKQSLN
jgi:inorganic pyrophosphatase/exopolyphosphatase